MLAVVNASAGSRRNNLSWRLRGKRWPERSKGQAGAAFVLISAALCGCAPVADASTSNVQATHTYLIARYSRATALLHTGVDPQINEITIGAQAPKAFPWSLSIGCAPHPYAILYGVLAPPGKSVVAQTPQGAISLNVIPIQPRLHARGPLVYGVFSALPSELTVLGVNDSTVYTENLEAKASEAAQFCEGYAEP